ncbi:hypothetical protein [Lichenicoccus sp.]|uniref:hypothetical protein n=1 Tax=Lichenicoccus sp. TaxID=2781899 RepID=UPI003D0C2180
MEQALVYRDVRYVIGPEQDGHRIWTIDASKASGVAVGSGARGSFKAAVMAAREAIDQRLGGTSEASTAA